jgi:hypothetical protein
LAGKNKQKTLGWDAALGKTHAYDMHKALGSIPSTAMNKAILLFH